MGFVFDNAVVAGTVLVREDIESQDFATGVSGWRISADGDAEFNNGIFRGTLSAGGGNVTVNSSGVSVVGTTQTTSIVPATGVQSRDNTDGSDAQLFALHGQGGGVFLYPPKGVNNVSWLTPGKVAVSDAVSGTSDAGQMFIEAPNVNGALYALSQIILTSGSSGSPAGSLIQIQANDVSTFSDFEVNGVLTAANRIVGSVVVTPSAANTPTSITVTFPRTLTGSAFFCTLGLNSSVPGSTVTGIAFTNASASGVTIWVTRTNTTNTIVNYCVEGV